MMAEERLAKKMELFYKLLGSYGKDARERKMHMDSRLFWKINVRVENGCLYCEKELSLWGKILDMSIIDKTRSDMMDLHNQDKILDMSIIDKTISDMMDLHNHWHRFLRVVVPLQIHAIAGSSHELGISPICGFNDNLPGELEGKLSIDSNGINFKGAYLIMVDSGINSYLPALGIRTEGSPSTHLSTSIEEAWTTVDDTLRVANGDFHENPSPSSMLVSESYVSVGRNIYLEADYAIEQPNAIDLQTDSSTESTVFYFCQLGPNCDQKGFVELKEKVDLVADNPVNPTNKILSENVQSITWSIYEGNEQVGQQKDFITGGRNQPSVALVGHHLVVVNQDQDLLMDKLESYLEQYPDDTGVHMLAGGLRSKGSWIKPYFEILLDTIPLSVEDKLTVGTFPFTNEEMHFYVGANPTNPKSQLNGSLKRLVFDPNSSCPSCPA